MLEKIKGLFKFNKVSVIVTFIYVMLVLISGLVYATISDLRIDMTLFIFYFLSGVFYKKVRDTLTKAFFS